MADTNVADNVKEAFKGTRGKVLLIGGGAVILYLWYTRTKDATPIEESASFDEDGRAQDRGDDSAAGDSGESTTARPTTNEEWISRAVSILSNPPYNRSTTAVYNALVKATEGTPITTSEHSLVELAIQLVGTPPNGMPPLNVNPPSTPSPVIPKPEFRPPRKRLPTPVQKPVAKRP